jgi:TolB-like protein/tetratricopeptide (TPR) repeat protein
MADVFISYARANADCAMAAAEVLLAAGVSVWIDDAIPTHRAFAEVIEERIREAKAVLVLWSEDAVKSHWVQSEADRARQEGKLVQVLLDDARPPMPFDRIQCQNLKGWSGDPMAVGWRKAFASLVELSNRSTQPLSLAQTGATLESLTRSTTEPPLLAVLAFENLSQDPEIAYFSDGVSNEILHTVAKTTKIRVLGGASTFQLRGEAKVPRNVSIVFGASHVLDGSVRRAGARLRVVAELVECSSQTQLWTERFDRDLADVFAVQDEIAEAVAGALKCAFAPSPKSGPISPRAYDLYLRARKPLLRGGAGQYFDLQLIEQALEIAPNFSEAWALLAFSRATVLRFPATAALGRGTTPSQNDWDLMRAAAEAAIRLDEGASLAYLALNLGQPLCGACDERGELMGKALAAQPNDPIVLLHAALDETLLGRTEAALDYTTQSAKLDPYYADPFRAAYLMWTGRRNEARQLYDAALRAWPGSILLLIGALRSAYEIDDWVWYDSIYTSLKADVRSIPIVNFVHSIANRFRNWSDQTSDEVLAQLRSEVNSPGVPSLYWAGACCARGRADDVFAVLDEARFERLFRRDGRTADFDGQYPVMFSPTCAEMRRDSRFVDICRRLGLCHEWASTERWPDFVDDPGLDYDLRGESRRIAQQEHPRIDALRRTANVQVSRGKG